MNLKDLLERVRELRDTVPSMLALARTEQALADARTALTGRKSGRLTELMKELPGLAPDERREAGAAINEAKTVIEAALEERTKALTQDAGRRTQPVDLTMPGRRQWLGAKHP